MPPPQRIRPCLWFDGQAEDAARFYTGIWPRSRILATTYFTSAGHEIHGRPAGSVMTVEFELDAQPFTALNGGPLFKFNEAISLQILCDTQADIDHYWAHLAQDGDAEAQQCGWLKDKFGVSWQVVPNMLGTLLDAADRVRAERTMHALLQMKKLDIAALRRAHDG